MEYRTLGTSSLRVSAVGLGSNSFGPPRLEEAAVRRVLHAALDQGINFVDTAPIYTEGQSEELIGRILQGRRQDVVIATKFHLRRLDGQRAYDRIHEHARESLRRLQTDYVDLYQVHFPNAAVAPDEILRALDDLVRAGQVRAIGCCNYASWRVAESIFTARTLGTPAFVTAQNHYSLLYRPVEQELMPFCEAYGLSLIPYYPLGGGFLTGKYRQGQPPPPGSRGAAGAPIVRRSSTERNWALLPKLEAFARERGRPLNELAIAWLLAHPTVGSVIAGASNPEQIASNAAAAAWQLTPAEVAELDAVTARDETEGPFEQG
jgi:aryl-alcohol dehydrogenase-like predicted oxidoreductase